MFTSRLLPRDEWPRLAGRQTAWVLELPSEAPAHVIVVEDAAGKIIGSWALSLRWQVEGIDIVPEHRGDGKVFRDLLEGMFEAARVVGAKAVVTSSTDLMVDRLLLKLHATSVPGAQWELPIPGGEKGP